MYIPEYSIVELHVGCMSCVIRCSINFHYPDYSFHNLNLKWLCTRVCEYTATFCLGIYGGCSKSNLEWHFCAVGF